MALLFSKHVKISNPRLECLHLFFCLVFATGQVLWFYWENQCLEVFEDSSRVSVSIVPVPVTQSELLEIYEDKSERCAGLEGNSSCVPPCPDIAGEVADPPVNSTPACVYAESLTTVLGTSAVFYTTAIRKSFFARQYSVSRVFPYEEAVALLMHIQVNSFTRPFATSRTPRTLDPSNPKDVQVVLLDHDEEVLEVVDEYGEGGLRLTWGKLLQMSGLSETYEAAVDQHVIVSLGIDIFVTCRDWGSAWNHLKRDVYYTAVAGGAKCLCTVHAERNAASARIALGRLSEDPTEQVSRSWQGVHLHAYARGMWSRVSAVQVYTAAVELIVLSKIPKFFALMVTLHLLGHLSHIYSCCIRENFDIAEQVAGTAARLTSTTAAFEDLCKHGADCVSKDTMHRRMMRAVADVEHLTPAELGRFVNFSYQALTELDAYVRYDSIAREVKEDVRRCCRLASGRPGEQLEGDDSLRTVSMHSFSRACSSVDKLQLSDTICLFRDRKVGRVERFFMPRYIRKLIDRGKRALIHEGTPESRTGQHPADVDFSGCQRPIDIIEPETQGARALKRVVELERRHQEMESQGKPLDRRWETLEDDLMQVFVTREALHRQIDDIRLDTQRALCRARDVIADEVRGSVSTARADMVKDVQLALEQQQHQPLCPLDRRTKTRRTKTLHMEKTESAPELMRQARSPHPEGQTEAVNLEWQMQSQFLERQAMGTLPWLPRLNPRICSLPSEPKPVATSVGRMLAGSLTPVSDDPGPSSLQAQSGSTARPMPVPVGNERLSIDYPDVTMEIDPGE